MPFATFYVKSVSDKPERRQNRTYNRWFNVWTVERQPDDTIPVGESLALYEITGPIHDIHAEWQASLCDRARILGLPVKVLWKDSRGWREIVELTLATEEKKAS